MVTTLHWKLWRDLWQMKGQVLTIALVVAVGVAVLVASMTTYRTLAWAQAYFYQHYHFADVFATLKRAPRSLAERIRAIPGVASVEIRIAKEANLDLADMDAPAVGYFTSLPLGHKPELNQLHLRSGRWLDDKRRDEILVGEAFAKAHRLQPGDKLVAILNGRRQELTIAGIVLSPEQVFVIRSQTFLPDNQHFGVFWLNEKAMESAFGMVGAFNNVVLKLTPKANQDEVIAQLDQLLLPYGGLGAQPRSEQMSNRYLQNEFQQLHFLATLIPGIFIAVAAFLLNIVTSRLIVLQRPHIAILKALGYSDWVVGGYYLFMVLIIVLLGSVLGTLFGIWIGKGLLAMYGEFFVFPVFDYQFSFIYPLVATASSLLAAFLGVIAAVYSVIRLPPSIAMRPPTPATYEQKWWDRSRFFNKLHPTMKMMLRNLLRRPIRNSLTSLGIGFGVAIVVLALFWQDAMNHVIDVQFMLAEREHALISYVEPTSAATLHHLEHLPGVITAEGYRMVPIRLRAGHRHYLTGMMGVDPDMQQRLILDQDLQKIQIVPEQLFISRTLADILRVKPGDMMEIDVLEGKRQHLQMPLARVVDDYVGLTAYMDLATLNRLLGDDRLITNVAILYDTQHEIELYKKLKNTPRVATIGIKRTQIKTFNETIAQTVIIFTTFLAGFAVVMGAGIVYNSARIALSERAWELASLRVLGFTRREVSTILLGELAILQMIAIPLGFLIGYALAKLSATLVPVELVRLPLIIQSRTYVFAAITILLAGLISGAIVRQRVKHLDLLAVLKTMD